MFNARGIALAFAVLITSGCESGSAPQAGPTRAHDVAQGQPQAVTAAVEERRERARAVSARRVDTVDAIAAPGAYALQGAHALAFETGMTWGDTVGIIEASARAGAIRPSGVTTTMRALAGTDIKVRTQGLEPADGEVSNVRLTHFDEWLVGVVITYKEADPQRVLAWARRFGQGVHGQGWVGWWLRDAQRIMQASPDGVTYEVFDLAAARRVVPTIDSLMLDSWRQRYKVPPPWGRALLEVKQAGQGAEQPSPP